MSGVRVFKFVVMESRDGVDHVSYCRFAPTLRIAQALMKQSLLVWYTVVDGALWGRVVEVSFAGSPGKEQLCEALNREWSEGEGPTLADTWQLWKLRPKGDDVEAYCADREATDV